MVAAPVIVELGEPEVDQWAAGVTVRCRDVYVGRHRVGEIIWSPVAVPARSFPLEPGFNVFAHHTRSGRMLRDCRRGQHLGIQTERMAVRVFLALLDANTRREG